MLVMTWSWQLLAATEEPTLELQKGADNDEVVGGDASGIVDTDVIELLRLDVIAGLKMVALPEKVA